jgi:hypothetical protein
VPLSATWFRDRLAKKAKRGFVGYPVASVAFYGPTDQQATKVAVGITLSEGADTDPLERWYTMATDARTDPKVSEEIVHFLQRFSVRSVVTPDRILGCSHEEGIDYPDGEACPACPFWMGRDRFTGKLLTRGKGEAR